MRDDGVEGHEAPDLVGLVGAELGRDGTIGAARHVKRCPACTEELIDLVVAHAALVAAADVNRELAPLDTTITDHTKSERTDERELEQDGEPVWPAFPPLVLAPRPGAAEREPRKRRRLVNVLAIAAAAVALAVLAVTFAGQHPAARGPVVAQAPLRRLETSPSTTGTVTVLAQGPTRNMIVRTKNLASPPNQKFYEVWLLDPATQKMLPVGVLPPSGTGEYQVTATLMAGYSAVDVSLQADNGNPAHSQTSVLRASL